jgi:hypothetical protein
MTDRSTDRELLEAAAKAAGIEHVGWDDMYSALVLHRGAHGTAESVWCPLHNKGEALDLQTRLGISIEPYPVYEPKKHSVVCQQRRPGDLLREPNPTVVVEVFGGRNPTLATCRAIVRCAAATTTGETK